MKKAGRNVSPVEIVGRKIATTFWGEAWCKNLEAYSDYSNRLPRGRSYVRNGSVVDVQIEAGRVCALVSGTDLYTVEIAIKPLTKKKWKEIKGQCADGIGSLVELLQGSISKRVMEIVTRKGEGLFPSPREITLDCSCPDWATMCKHVAATLYGVGARLDHEPDMLFTLRGVDPAEMVAAAIDQPAAAGRTRKGRVLRTDELSAVFGVDIDMDGVSPDERATSTAPAKRRKRATKAGKPAAAKTSGKRTGVRAPVGASVAEEITAPKTQTAKRKTAKKSATDKRTVKKKTAGKVKATNKARKKTTRKRKPVAKKAKRKAKI